MISGGAWSELPLSGIRVSDDVSEPNPLTDLLSDPRAELAFMFRGLPFDPDLDAERPVYVSSHGYAALDDGGGAAEGVPDHAHFPGSLASAYSVKVNLLSGGSWQASALPGYGAVVIANPDGRHDDLLRLEWENRQITVWVGRRQWIGPSFKTLGRVFQGVVNSLTWDASRIVLAVRDLRQLFDEEVNKEAYLGFGTAVRLRATGDRVTIPYDTWTRPVDGEGNPVLAVELMIRPKEVGDAILCTQGGSAGWVGRLHPDGSVGLYDRDLTNWIRTGPGVIVAGVPARVGFYGDTEGLCIRVDGRTKASNNFPYGGPVVVADVTIGGPPL